MPTTEVPHRRPVVAAAIVDSLTNPRQLLCTPRAYPASLRGEYEFPGGKVEPHETPRQALRRELLEELSLEVTLGAEVIPPGLGARPRGWPILEHRTMRVWCATPKPQQTPQVSGSHLFARWVDLSEVKALPWLRTNSPILNRLLETIGQN